MKVFPIKLHNDKMETTRILMTSTGKDRSTKLHSVSCNEMLVDFESKLEGPDEFVAEGMPLLANFAVQKGMFLVSLQKQLRRIETFVQVTHQR